MSLSVDTQNSSFEAAEILYNMKSHGKKKVSGEDRKSKEAFSKSQSGAEKRAVSSLANRNVASAAQNRAGAGPEMEEERPSQSSSRKRKEAPESKEAQPAKKAVLIDLVDDESSEEKDVSEYENEASKLFYEGKYLDAEKKAKEGLQVKKTAFLYELAAWSLFNQRGPVRKEAEWSARNGLKLEKTPGLYEVLARVLEYKNQRSQAFSKINEGLELEKTSGLWGIFGLIKLKQSNHLAAEDAARNGLAIEETVELYQILYRSLRNQKKYQEAIQVCEKALVMPGLSSLKKAEIKQDLSQFKRILASTENQ